MSESDLNYNGFAFHPSESLDSDPIFVREIGSQAKGPSRKIWLVMAGVYLPVAAIIFQAGMAVGIELELQRRWQKTAELIANSSPTDPESPQTPHQIQSP